MEVLEQYLSGDSYCSVCLRSASETKLLRSADVEFFSAIQVIQVTPYLCSWCCARIRVFRILKRRALRAQYWLYNLHHTQTLIADPNQPNLETELNGIKIDALTCDLTVSVSCNGKLYHSENISENLRQGGDDHNVQCQVKTEPERDQNWAEMKIEIEEWEESKEFINKALHREDETKDTAARPKYAKLTSSLPIDITNGRTTKPKLRADLRKTRKITESSGQVILDESDDVGVMLADLMGQKIVPMMLTEEQYRTQHHERLAKPTYTSMPHKCEICAVAFRRRHLYDKHMARHSPSHGAHRCHMCGTYHKTARELSTHKSSHLRRYSCLECAHTGYNRQDVANHYFALHTSVRFFCRHCGLQTRGPFLVKEHIMTKHLRRDDILEECPICKKSVKRRSYARHERSHTALPPVRCAICSNTFKHVISLRQHMAKMHADKPQNFEECPKCRETILSSDMAVHMRKHSEAAVCVVCKKTFTHKYGLREHMQRLHSGRNRRFQCDVCGAAYTTKAVLRRHISFVHMKTGGVSCHVCGRLCSHLGDMRSHVKNVHEKHLARRNKLCDFCGKGFTTARILKYHRLIHTGERPHACEVCGRRFRQDAALRTHVKLKHRKRQSLDTGQGGLAAFGVY